MALTVNRRVIVRPNVFLCLVSLLVIEAMVTTLQPQHLGTVYRTFRLAEFVAALWLLTPWWGRRDLLLVRCHLASLVRGARLGASRPPGGARPCHRAEGRLTGVLWPMSAHAGRALCGGHARAGGRALARRPGARPGHPGCVTVATVAMLILTHTRTALAGLVAGILVAGLSLFAAKARVRKFFAAGSVVVSIVIMTLSSVVTTWLARGRARSKLTDSHRPDQRLGVSFSRLPRNKFQEIFGFGLSKRFVQWPPHRQQLARLLPDGRALWGGHLRDDAAVPVRDRLLPATRRPARSRPVPRDVLPVASFTEVGFTDASTYLLDLTLAASLLVPPLIGRRAV